MTRHPHKNLPAPPLPTSAHLCAPSSNSAHMGCVTGCVMFCNTHSIFADIVQAEIFKPDLSNLIPNSSHIFACFRALPTILTFSGTFSPRSACYPSTLFPITSFSNSYSYCVYLIVSHLSCCIMIHDIASHAPSVCSFRVLSSFFMHP